MRRFLTIVAALMVLGTAVFAQSPAPPQAAPPTLESLELGALERHPAVREAAARVEAARGRATQAGAWENPVLGGWASELRPRESPSGAYGVFVEQAFTLGGKRQAERATARAEVATAEADLDAARQRVRASLRLAYYDLAAAADAVSVAERLAGVAAESVVLARQLVNVGIADRPDVLGAEADAARQQAALASARARHSASWRRLAIAASTPSMPMPTAAMPTGSVPLLDRDDALQRILENHPGLKVVEAAIASERLAVDVERRRSSPNLLVRAEAGWNRERLFAPDRSEALGWEFGAAAGLSLPLFNKNRGGIIAAQSSASAAEAHAARVRLEIEARFSSVFEEYETARLTSEALRVDVLPRLEEAHALMLARYREMATPYPQVLLAQRTLAEATEQYVEAAARAWKAAARIQTFLMDEGTR